ncbi:calcineurin-like phosphoesterase C-terminal domain-containing protein [Chitinophaga japonensis]|uniref:3',5'-cyclic AMP phosphodiesterase CpdA n=1 Tax=Chitinophaga japonensis TaxID=104662 RepID=A0A562SUZ8_CHIJA|nr:calcineurin-like phosphoesterase family protein [Chitinophaga japonensis]TWI84470.1 3',5'-cyclic AMP phosphodiesterase CpdA [Chitinophaga japonensis]
MQRRNFLKRLAGAGALATAPAAHLLGADRPLNGSYVKGKVTAAGKGLAGVVVSDGYTVTATDPAGNYRIALHSDAGFVFISIPAGYHIPQEKGIARFYQPLLREQATQTANFDLQRNTLDDHKHALVIWADTQMVKDEDAVTLLNVSAPDTAAEVRSLGNIPVHGITVGDLVHDRFDLFDDYAKAVEATGIPFFQVIGNHDMNYAARTDEGSQQQFRKLFGPNYFSFNRGRVHYVMLDDVFFIGRGHSYIGYLTETQLAWLEKDLQYVPAGSTVIVSLHIPTNTGQKEREGMKEEPAGGVVSNRQHLYELLRPYKVHIMSGHTHWNESWEKDHIMEHNHGTVCGAWWRPQQVAADGTPNGYAIYEIDGDTVQWYYKSTGKPRELQMRLYKPGSVAARPGAVIANVWNWDPQWKVEWWEDGQAKGVMEQIRCQDPVVVASYPAHMHVRSDHFFAAVPAAGTKALTVQATDRFGKVYKEELRLTPL